MSESLIGIVAIGLMALGVFLIWTALQQINGWMKVARISIGLVLMCVGLVLLIG